ncbi:hypothetical protein SAMN02745127_01489 [Oceanospirillum multiglobuliferum]|uniref:Uncharacterized protein n=1 Tax=Oceanospirillum multiglobuliferum TaxID=64969 RepID=A0A1T4PGZ0_9GAMM|nr:hypothetical protein [Oceanospirillum multiglobuliferum]OPX55554.1 hypothetical protein BTE48_07995 [Oceanospirillum multiglobuliferum]SJZ90661.1 hypothetical protein SAMN02745127_01489 [Oceanospirillum multiglobuliferum]
MEKVITSLIEQWPALTGLIVIAGVFWVLFRRYLDENKILLEGVKSLSSEHKDSINQVLDRYRVLSEDQVKEIDRLRILVSSLVTENEKIGKRYDDIKSEFHKVALENGALKRAIDNLEEMMRATGGDVKVISTQLRKTQEDIEDVSSKIMLLERHSDESST